jgi:hypothetical protein
MTTHRIKDSKVRTILFVTFVLDGDWTAKFKEKDVIKTSLAKYRIDSFGFDAKLNVTTVIVREIFLEQKET